MRKPIETPRLRLRPVAPRDAKEIRALLSDPLVFRFLLDGAPAGAAFVCDLIEESDAVFQAAGAGMFLATLRESSATVGLMGFRRAEIGGLELVCALWPRYWRRGLAAEGCQACLDHAFAQPGISELLAAADVPNSDSLALIERLGFHPLRETPGAFGAIRWFVLRRA